MARKAPGKTRGPLDGTQTVRLPLSSLHHFMPNSPTPLPSHPLSLPFLLPPQVFAQQGYLVIAINPTGSTSFGQSLTDGIQANWGGRPIQDLLAGLQHALKIYPEVDENRLAGLGASYGGYAINWIQGHNDVFGFKALVCHDGIFSTSDVSWQRG